jgi:general stress protein 26
MDLKMTAEERDAFLKGPRVAIVAIEQPQGAPLAVPIWFGYDPSVGIWISTTDDSLKAKRLRAAGRFTLVVQEEERPHRYVSAEGPVVEFRPVDAEKDIRPMAEAYAPDAVEMYVEASSQIPSSLVVMKPEVWRSMDQSKMS